MDTSSHLKYWIFPTNESLALCREKTRLKAQKELTALLSSNGYENSSSYLIDPTTEEEIIRYYAKKLVDICTKMQYSLRVTFTAATFYQRFYIKNSLMNFDPTLLIVTCIFAAGKAEENFLTVSTRGIDLPNLCKLLNQHSQNIQVEAVIYHESHLLEALGFQLQIYHSLDIIEFFLTNLDLNSEQELRVILQGLAPLPYYSEAILLFTPLKLATALLFHAIRQLKTPLSISNEELVEKIKQIKPDTFDSSFCLTEIDRVIETLLFGNRAVNKKLCKDGVQKLAALSEIIFHIKSNKRKLREENVEQTD